MTSDREQELIAPRHRRRLLGPISGSLLLTTLSMLAVELTDDTVLRVPGLALMLLVAPLVAFRYGLLSGLISVALVVLYSAYYFSTPGQLLRYSDEDMRRLLAISTLSLILTLMIGALRRAVLAREVQLRRQLGFANAIAGSLGEGVYAVDREDRLTFMNPAAERMLGWGEAELLGESVHGTIHCRRPDGTRVPSEECPILEVLRTGITYRSDDVFTARDGTMFPVALTSSPILEDGRVAGAVVAFRDITERVWAQAALSQSEERFRTIFEGAAIGIRLSTLEGRTLDSNPAWQRMLGYGPEELQGMHFSQYTHPEDVTADAGLFAELIAGKRDRYELEKRYIRKDGQVIWGRLTVSLIRDATGEPQFTVGMIEDITEGKRAQEALRKSEASLAEAQRIAHVGSWEWDLNTDELHWSDEAYRIFGFEPGGIVPTYETFWNLVHPEDREYVRRALRSALYEGKLYDIEHRIVRPDGETRTVHRQGDVVFDEAGRPVQMFGILYDITERKQAEEQKDALLTQVRQALDLRNQFLSIASHELKTPVTLMKGYAQLLEGRARQKGYTDTLKPLQVINRQVGRMTRLIDDLLDVSRIESGRIKFEMAPFDLAEALGEVVSEVAVSVPDYELRMYARATDAWVMGDRGRIQQVITNLLTNAVKYSRGCRQIDISLEQRDERVMVSVTDYGIGIPAEQQSEVFGLYFRAANASADNYGGLGMGLYISKRIIDRHGGTIGLVSEEGQGSTFYFSLPLTQAVGQTGEPATAEA